MPGDPVKAKSTASSRSQVVCDHTLCEIGGLEVLDDNGFVLGECAHVGLVDIRVLLSLRQGGPELCERGGRRDFQGTWPPS